ncbi:MAG: ribosome recycling factor [Clostridia bacterium]|nr:ribosome recycling factor [Clostridia bacterium]
MKYEIKPTEEKMKKAIAAYEENLSSIRLGKASAAVLSKVMVDYYGTPTEINQMAAVKVADPKTLEIAPWDASSLKDIEKAILASDIGITPQNDGKVIRLIFPQLTEERRKEVQKQVAKMGEDCKVAIRNIRRDANDKCKDMKKNGEMNEDEQKASEKQIQELTDKYVKEVDVITDAKNKEVMSI